MKKRILIYGDSNTWGDPGLGRPRYRTHEQWPNILQKKLGDNYEIVQEGLGGRIAGDHDKQDTHRNGRIGYEIALRSASPVNYVIVALGTNDVKDRYGLSVDDIVEDLSWYESRTLEYAEKYSDEMPDFKKVLYVGAANFKSNAHFDVPEGYSDELNRQLQLAGKELVVPNNLEHTEDGLHYSRSDHEKVAQRVYERLKDIEQ